MPDHHITIAPDGRLQIPEELRLALGLPEGGTAVASMRDGALVIEPFDAVLARVQARVRSYVPVSRVLSEELIADRRREALDE